MSDEELKRLPSLQGYVNLSELKRIALATIASSGLLNVVLMVLVSVLQQSDKWLTGTRVAVFVPALTMLAAWIQTRYLSSYYLKKGD